MASTQGNSITKWVMALGLGTLAHFIGVGISGALLVHLGLQLPQVPPPSPTPLMALGGSFSIALAASILLSGMAGSYWSRALSVAFFLLAAGGINTSVESAIFTTLGGNAFIVGMWLLSGLLTAFTMAAVLKPAPGQGRWDGLTPVRLLAGWAFFPPVYLFFGELLSPWILPYYNGGAAFLKIPPMTLVLAVQAARSLLFLGCSLPFIGLWTRTRWSLWLALGWMHYTVVDMYGNFLGTFLPLPLRMAHGVEIFGDSMAYGAILVLLLRPKETPAAKQD